MRRKTGYFWIALLFAVLFVAFVSVSSATGTTPAEEVWNKTFGGSGDDEAYTAQQTLDGGYILAGYTESYSVGGRDVWLVKTDSKGKKQWDKTFGGYDNDAAWSIQQTLDGGGGYILAGYTESYGAGSKDVWLVKTYPNGSMQWYKTFGGSGDDVAYSVNQVEDDGYILAGYTRSYGAGSKDVWLVKTYPNGSMQWNTTFGGSGDDVAHTVQQTEDGGYILAGYRTAMLQYVLLLKTYPNGSMQWYKTFGGSRDDVAYTAQQTEDGGYILAGYTKPSASFNYDVLLVKTYPNGTRQWGRSFGGARGEWANSIQQTSDGGYIFAGPTIYGASGASITAIWLVKIDPNGSMQWDMTFGGTKSDLPRSVQQTVDGDYILAGYTKSYGAGSMDFWLIKVRAAGSGNNNPNFDTGSGTYPSISGTHKGEIKPSDNITVSKMYTYSCAGTGGHTRSIELYENGTLIASDVWDGYQYDWHNITINPSVILHAGHTYNYTIVTGSYPQIIHAKNKDVTGGIITCKSFVDANGKIYSDWIPAIKFFQ
ncbi:MAG: hypothetical protein WAV32_10800 [Halobacteriota archaeon]